MLIVVEKIVIKVMISLVVVMIVIVTVTERSSYFRVGVGWWDRKS